MLLKMNMSINLFHEYIFNYKTLHLYIFIGMAPGHMGEGHMGIGHMGTGHMGTGTHGYQDIRVPGHMGTRTHGYRDIWV